MVTVIWPYGAIQPDFRRRAGQGKIPLLYKVRSVEKSSRRNYVTRFGSNMAALAKGTSDAYEADLITRELFDAG